MNVITYHRVSTRDQNPALARNELRAYCRSKGWEVVAEIEETGSGGKRNRPGLMRAMEMARKRQTKAIVVWKLDRFGRTVGDLASNLAELHKLGVTFVASSQGISHGPDSDAAARFTIHILMAVAELERELGAERSVLSARALKAEIERRGFFVSREGVKRYRLGRPPKLDPAQVERIGRAVEEGLSAFIAARKLGIPETTVRRYMRQIQTRQKPLRRKGS